MGIQPLRLGRCLLIFATVCFACKVFSKNFCDNELVFSGCTSSGTQMLLGYKKRGDAFFRDGQFEEAKKAYGELLNCMLIHSANLSKSINTDDSFIGSATAEYDAYARKGHVCMELGDASGAIGNFSKMIEINFLYPYGYIMRALAYQDKGLYDGALSDVATLIKLYPDFYYPYRLQGEILYQQKKLNKALVSLNKAIELAPDSSESYFLRGNVLSDMGDSLDALNDYSKAVEISQDIRAFYNRGVLYFSNEQYDKALPDFIYISENEPAGSPYLRHVYWRIANPHIS